MWNKLMGINSFVLWPVSLVFVVYAAGHAVLTLEWKLFVIALLIFAVLCVASIVLAIMSD